MALRNVGDDPGYPIALDIVMLHDDTEEDLVGSDLHQIAIRTLYEGLWLAGPERGLPWHVSTQLMVLMGKLQGKQWHPSPDILVHPTAGPDLLTSFDIKTHGVPPFVIEVASPATWEYDIGSKANAYGYVGVQEYVAFDPTTDLLGTSVIARRQTPEGFKTWTADAAGYWHSAVLGISLQVEGPLLRVFDANGVRLPIFTEQARQRDEWTRQLEEQARLRDEWTRQLQEQARLRDEQARQLEEQARRIAELEAEMRRLRTARDDR